jgi:hypothetical protein
MQFRNAATTVLMAVLVAVAAGCAGNNDAHGGGNDNGNGGDNGARMQGYSDDGYLGITSSYPRIPGRHMALNYSSDARMIRESIRDVRGVDGADITFHGAEAYVALRLKSGLADREIPTIERNAASVLRFNFPRYTVHVTSKSTR